MRGHDSVPLVIESAGQDEFSVLPSHEPLAESRLTRKIQMILHGSPLVTLGLGSLQVRHLECVSTASAPAPTPGLDWQASLHYASLAVFLCQRSDKSKRAGGTIPQVIPCHLHSPALHRQPDISISYCVWTQRGLFLLDSDSTDRKIGF